MRALYLVFDVGTTSLKSSVFDETGAIVATELQEYSLLTPGKDTIEADPELYWNAVVQGSRAVVGQLVELGHAAEDIQGIGVCSQGETVILLDADDRPLRNAIVWMDNRATVQARQIEEELGANRSTGMPEVDPMWSAPKLLWVKQNQPELYKKVRRVLLVEDYVIYRLTGCAVSDFSLYPTSYLYDIYRKQWWQEMLSLLDLHPRQLPELLPPGSTAGNLAAAVAADMGLAAGLPVIAGGMDQTAAMVGAGNLEPGMVTETTGGALALCTTLTAEAVESIRNAEAGPLAELPVQPHILADGYLATQWCQSGGMSLRWTRDTLFSHESRAAQEAGEDAYNPVTTEAAGVAPGSEGLFFLPYMAGSGTVAVAHDVRGVFWGLELHHSRGHMARAVMESIGYLLRLLVEQIEAAGLSCSDIRLLGGGARSSLWRQMKADITGRTVAAVTCPEAASLGVAMQVAVATGAYTSLREAARQMSSLSQTYQAEPAVSKVYDDSYRKFVNLHGRIS